MPLGSIFPANLLPQIHQNPSKIDAKMPSHVDFIFLLFFDGFLLPTSTPGTSRIKPPLQREHDLSKIAFRNLYRLFIDFGANKLPFSFRNPPKSLRKSILEGISFLIDFSTDFFVDFCGFGGPTWRHVGNFFLQKAAATGANLYYLGSMFFFGFLAILTPPWHHLGSIWEGPRLDFGRLLGSILKAFGLDFGSFW